MHGLVNRSLQSFLRNTYGPSAWTLIAEQAGAPPDGFEAMFSYEDALTDCVLDVAVRYLAKPRDALLEDLGMFLVTREELRRLLRFGGVDYVAFLHSLDELPDRARLAVADLGLPDLELEQRSDECFALRCGPGHAGWTPVLAGVLRAMADDYGAFALVDIESDRGTQAIRIELMQTQYATGRRFDLARPVVA